MIVDSHSTHNVTHPGLLTVDPDAVIDKSSPVPLHHQLEVFLRQGIESGLFPANETLPTEQDLQDYFQLSRTPIRQALAKLSTEGLVDRRRSIGTIVLPRPFEESLRSLTTFTEEVQRKGMTPGSTMLEFSIIPADAEVIRQLDLKPSTEIFFIRRLRLIDDEPAGILTACIPVHMVPELQKTDFAERGRQQSIYYVLEQVHGLRPVQASETFRAVALDTADAMLLKLPPFSAVLMRSRTTFDTAGRAIAFETGLYRGVYRLEWMGREVSASGVV